MTIDLSSLTDEQGTLTAEEPSTATRRQTGTSTIDLSSMTDASGNLTGPTKPSLLGRVGGALGRIAEAVPDIESALPAEAPAPAPPPQVAPAAPAAAPPPVFRGRPVAPEAPALTPPPLTSVVPTQSDIQREPLAPGIRPRAGTVGEITGPPLRGRLTVPTPPEPEPMADELAGLRPGSPLSVVPPSVAPAVARPSLAMAPPAVDERLRQAAAQEILQGQRFQVPPPVAQGTTEVPEASVPRNIQVPALAYDPRVAQQLVDESPLAQRILADISAGLAAGPTQKFVRAGLRAMGREEVARQISGPSLPPSGAVDRLVQNTVSLMADPTSLASLGVGGFFSRLGAEAAAGPVSAVIAKVFPRLVADGIARGLEREAAVAAARAALLASRTAQAVFEGARLGGALGLQGAVSTAADEALKGQIHPEDLIRAFGKGALVGGLTGGAAGAAAGVAARLGPVPATTTRILTTVLGFGTLSPVIEQGRPPTWQDLADAGVTVGAFELATGIAAGLRRLSRMTVPSRPGQVTPEWDPDLPDTQARVRSAVGDRIFDRTVEIFRRKGYTEQEAPAQATRAILQNMGVARAEPVPVQTPQSGPDRAAAVDVLVRNGETPATARQIVAAISDEEVGGLLVAHRPAAPQPPGPGATPAEAQPVAEAPKRPETAPGGVTPLPPPPEPEKPAVAAPEPPVSGGPAVALPETLGTGTPPAPGPARLEPPAQPVQQERPPAARIPAELARRRRWVAAGRNPTPAGAAVGQAAADLLNALDDQHGGVWPPGVALTTEIGVFRRALQNFGIRMVPQGSNLEAEARRWARAVPRAAVAGQPPAPEAGPPPEGQTTLATPAPGPPPVSPLGFRATLYQGRGKSPEEIYGPENVAQGRGVPLVGPGEYYAFTERDAARYGQVTKHEVVLQRPFILVSDRQWFDLLAAADARQLSSVDNVPGSAAEATQRLQRYLVGQGYDSLVARFPPPREGDVGETGANIKRLRESFGHSTVIKFPRPPEGPPGVQPSPPAAAAPTPPEQMPVASQPVDLNALGPAMRQAEIQGAKVGQSITFKGEVWEHRKDGFWYHGNDILFTKALVSHIRDLGATEPSTPSPAEPSVPTISTEGGGAPEPEVPAERAGTADQGALAGAPAEPLPGSRDIGGPRPAGLPPPGASQPDVRGVDRSGRAIRRGPGVGEPGGIRAGGARPERPPVGGGGPTGAGDDIAVPERSAADLDLAPKTDSPPQPPVESGRDYVITADDGLGEGGPKEKFRRNLEAIRTLKRLEGEQRPATPEDQRVLVRYVGWGGLPQVFEPSQEYSWSTGEWRREFRELKDALTPEEYEQAGASVKNAHYTSGLVVDRMWQALDRLGFRGGRILEPAAGIGHFLGLQPIATIAGRVAVELDPITGRILRALYPQATVKVQGFETVHLPDNFFEVAISNVPFGDFGVVDTTPNASRYGTRGLDRRIHDYFLAKMVDKVRPGGLVAAITSSGSLDKIDRTARRYLAEQAELIGAIRLPNTAFKANAGTEVTTDILFLRKREQPISRDEADREAWVESVDRPDLGTTGGDWTRRGGRTPVRPFRLSAYFQDHPEMVLGQLAPDTLHRDRLGVESDGRDLGSALDEAIQRLPERVLTPAAHPATDPSEPATREALGPAAGVTLPGGYAVAGDGLLYQNTGEIDAEGRPRLTKVEIAGRVRERIVGMLGVRDALRGVLRVMLTPPSADADLARAQRQLATAYDRFVRHQGAIHAAANAQAMQADPDYRLLQSLEDWDPKAKQATKAAIFTQRTIPLRELPTQADSPEHALLISLNETGGIDWDRMAGLLGQSPTELREALRGRIFRNPEGTWETADAYLSGDVRAKLKAASAAAEADPAYAENVAALQRVQPEDLPPEKITVRLGVPWIGADDLADFVAQTFAVSRTRVEATYAESVDLWRVTVDGRDHDVSTVEAEREYGAASINGLALLNQALNLRRPRIYSGSGKDRVFDPEATIVAERAQRKLADRFAAWVWEDPERATRLGRVYNDRYNHLRDRTWDGAHLTLPGMALGWREKLRPHQRNAVARGLQGGNLLLAHLVGAGKTSTMAAIAMESKRLGLAKKPMFAVPNHMVEQFAREFREVYPAAQVLAPTKLDAGRAGRQAFMSRIVTGLWDAVIVPHSYFTRLPVTDATWNQHLREQIHAARDALRSLRIDKADRLTVKQVETAIARLEAKLRVRAPDKAAKDRQLHFEDLGVDLLFVDEAQLFKNLYVPTKMTRVKGIGQSESDRAFDLFAKTQWLTGINRGRGVVFATGTPISNSMAEAFTMQRYLDYRALKAAGLAHFDQWAKLFGEVVTSVEMAVEGRYRESSRFARFTNLPELMTMLRSIADIQQDRAALGLPVPALVGGKPIVRVSPMSPGQLAYSHAIIERVKALSPRTKDVDNMLKITTDARLNSLDPRLVDPEAPDNPQGKATLVADEVAGIWRETASRRGTQLVFLDLATPKAERAPRTTDERPAYLMVGTEPAWRLTAQQAADALHATHDDVITDDKHRQEVIKALEAGERVRREVLADYPSVEAGVGLSRAAQTHLAALLGRPGPVEPAATESELTATGDAPTVETATERLARDQVYGDIRQKLLARGVPDEEIAFIHDATTPEAKQRLFDDVNAGRIRVLLGSTEKMGVGTNVQERVVAGHHVDAPWRPADIEQRDGRYVRQGNTNPEVGTYHYVSQGANGTMAFDGFLWQTLQTKWKFITQVMRGASSVRTLEDVGDLALTSGEAMAAATGDPRVLEKVNTDNELGILDVLRAEHGYRRNSMRREAASLPSSLTAATRAVDAVRQDLATREAHVGDVAITLGGRTITDREAATRGLTAATDAIRHHADLVTDRKIGEFRGFDVLANSFNVPELNPESGALRHVRRVQLALRRAGTYHVAPYLDAFSQRLAGLETDLSQARAEVKAREARAAKLDEEIAKPFEHETRYEELLRKKAELDEALGVNQAEPGAPAPEGPEPEEGPQGGEPAAFALTPRTEPPRSAEAEPQTAFYRDMLRQAPELSPRIRLADLTGSYPADFVQALVQSPEAAPVARAIGEAMGRLRRDLSWEHERAVYGGWGLGEPGMLAVNLDGRLLYPDDPYAPNLIFTHPLEILDSLPSPDAGRFADRVVAALLHELTHQQDRGHREQFASYFTLNIGDALQTAAEAATRLRGILEADNGRLFNWLTGLLDAYRQHRPGPRRSTSVGERIGGAESRATLPGIPGGGTPAQVPEPAGPAGAAPAGPEAGPRPGEPLPAGGGERAPGVEPAELDLAPVRRSAADLRAAGYEHAPDSLRHLAPARAADLARARAAGGAEVQIQALSPNVHIVWERGGAGRPAGGVEPPTAAVPEAAAPPSGPPGPPPPEAPPDDLPNEPEDWLGPGPDPASEPPTRLLDPRPIGGGTGTVGERGRREVYQEGERRAFLDDEAQRIAERMRTAGIDARVRNAPGRSGLKMVLTRGREGLEKLQAILDPPFRSVQMTIAPVAVGRRAQETAGALREHRAWLERDYEVARVVLQQAARMLDAELLERRYAFIDAIEHGRIADLPDWFQGAGQQLRQALDTRRELVRALGTGALEHFYEDYFPHIWQRGEVDPQSVIAKIMGRRPLEGPKGFLKKRTLPTFMDGIDAGLKPVSDNPVTLTLLKIREMDRYIMGQRVFQELKDKGLIKFGRGFQRPEGWAAIDDAIARRWQYSEEEGGFVKRGEYYAPVEVARIINNYLRPGLFGRPLYDFVRGGANLLNSLQLGFSFFHAGFVTMDAAISSLALGLQELSVGEQRGLWGATKALTGIAPFTTFVQGNKLLREYYRPGSQGAEMATILDGLIAAGGRARMPRYYTNWDAMTKFGEAWRKGDTLGQLRYGLPAFVEAAFWPTMEYIVPRIKLGVFAEMARFELDRLPPNASRDEVRRVLGGVWDSVDNRLGQVVYDNIFWGRRFKDAMMLAFRSVGWNWGTYREMLGGGLVDLPLMLGQEAERMARGHRRFREENRRVDAEAERFGLRTPRVAGALPPAPAEPPGPEGPEPPAFSESDAEFEARWRWRTRTSARLPRRLAYLIASGVVVSMASMLIQYLFTGEGPQSPMDLVDPRTGKKNRDGSDQRIVLPTYWSRDGVSYLRRVQTEGPMRGTVGFLGAKLHPWLVQAWETLVTNRDYRGGYIVPPKDAHPLWSMLRYNLEQEIPFGWQNIARQIEQAHPEFKAEPGWQRWMDDIKAGIESPESLLPLVGVTPAPYYATHTPEQILERERQSMEGRHATREWARREGVRPPREPYRYRHAPGR